MRIGIVSPYDFDIPGGVQAHILQLAASLRTVGHEVNIIGPGQNTHEPGLTLVGKSIPVPYNGSIARLAYGPRVAGRVRKWLRATQPEVLHVHEPATPSVSLLAVGQSPAPIVATFHSAQVRSQALHIAYPVLRPLMERLAARIAVSEEARRTAVEHLGGDALVIPNGVDTSAFRNIATAPTWQGLRTGGTAPTVAFLGRLDEPRKGLHVLAQASHAIRAAYPDAKFLLAGRGPSNAAAGFAPGSVHLLGTISDAEKAQLLASADVFVAPQLGGESFGIVLVEAMSAGCPVVASDLAAFHAVLDEGRGGLEFRTGDVQGLAHAVLQVLSDPAQAAMRTRHAQLYAGRFDWSRVSQDVCDVYELVSGRLPRDVRGRGDSR